MICMCGLVVLPANVDPDWYNVVATRENRGVCWMREGGGVRTFE